MTSTRQLASLEPRRFNLQKIWPHLAVCLLLFVIFVMTAVAAWDLGLGRFSAPDTGLWPFLASIAGSGLSAGLLLTVLLGVHDQEADLFADVQWVPTTVFAASILGFLVLYPMVGFLVSAIPMTFVLLKYAAGARWIPAVAVTMVAPVVLYFIFREVLNVRF